LIDVLGFEKHGDTLTLQVGHSEGCERHDYMLCWHGGLEQLLLAPISLELIHDSHGDTCEAYLTETLSFDLSPLARAYMEAFQTAGGVLHFYDGYGLYAFGELSCDDRLAASFFGALFSLDENRYCESADDCVLASLDTACSAECGAVVSTTGLARLNAELDYINSTICEGYAQDDCGPVLGPECEPPPPIDCVHGTCTAQKASFRQ
jgi:hypothetical protein